MTEPKKPTVFNEGDIYYFRPDNPQNRMPKVPIGTYLVCASMEMGYFLKRIPDFDLPKRLYGDIETKAARILNTFQDRPKTTGVLLSGEKGSGKTLLSKLICSEGQLHGYPTLVVNNDFQGDSFNTFIQNIEQPCIVLFDEFEKVYDEDAQRALLTLFDGVFTTKKLLLLTTNNYIKINNHLQNRPGRLYYMLDFKGLDKSFILEYGKEHLKNKQHLTNLSVVLSMVNPISFDILQAIIEESNRYNESPTEVLDMLNVKAHQGFKETFLVELHRKDNKKLVRIEEEKFIDPYEAFTISYYVEGRKKKDGTVSTTYDEIIFRPSDMKSLNGIEGIYQFENKEGTLKLTRKPIDKHSKFEQYKHLAVYD